MRSMCGSSLSRLRATCSSTHKPGSRQTTIHEWSVGTTAGSVKRLPRTVTSSGAMPSREVMSSAEVCRLNSAK